MTKNNTCGAPEIYGLSYRAKEFLKLKQENKNGLYTEYCPWMQIYRTNAMKATADEKNDLIRGGKAAMHILCAVPVDIAPYEVFATYGLVGHSQEDIDSSAYPWKGFPYNYATHNHISLDYKKLLERGISGILAEIDEKLAALDQFSDDEDVKRKLSFYESLKLSLDAVLCYADRFKKEAQRLLALESDPSRKRELERLALTLEKVPLQPAETFFEVLQSLLIYYFAMRIVTCEWISVGRLDYILHEYYERDLAQGLITRKEAAELLQVPRIKSAIMTGQSDSFILAGSNADGTPFWNDITYFILDATQELSLRGPQLWFRYAPGQPRELMRRALQPIKKGNAQPGFYNDAVAVPAMLRAGFSLEHSYDYVCCQCVELSPQGRSSILSAYYYRNLAKLIEILMNNGKQMIEDDPLRPWTLKEVPDHISLKFDTFEDFQKAYEEYLRCQLRQHVKDTNEILAAGAKMEINFTISSALLDGCIESGLCALDGGALYNQSFPNFSGQVTAADSLAAIRQYVFEEKKATLEELAQMCKDNFEGNEDVRQYLLNRCPKYGNGDPRADSLVGWIVGIIDDELLKHRNIFGDVYAAQQFGFTAVDRQATKLAATPDGRLYGEAPSATLGGDLGRERNGITALFNSVTSFDHTASPGGLNVNLRISPSILAKDDDLEKMIDLLITYFQNGGMEVQVNCVSKETLIDAQKRPEKYKDLCIRVSGQSLYFVELGIALQNQIISRVEHSL